MSTTDTDIRPKIKVKTDIAEPRFYKVIYMNDDATTFEFVVETLRAVFGHTQEIAETLTAKVHEDGSAVVAVLPYEIAEQKGLEVTALARANGFPLLIKIEQE
jgi:ATP-dependent Clp protease adaptor protein ClpS